MKKFYLLFIFFNSLLNAQTPDYNVYPGDVVLQSYKPADSYSGNLLYDLGTWKIDSILESGNPVIFDIFATWCDPCWDFHKSGVLEEIYDSIGWGGTNEVAIFGVESSPATAKGELVSNSYGRDWVSDTKYPMVNKSELEELFNITYYPDIVVICPDRTVVAVNSEDRSKKHFLEILSNCHSKPELANDPRILESSTLEKSFACGDQTTAQVNISVIVQNYGVSEINDSIALIVTDFNGNVLTENKAKVMLSPFEYSQVDIGEVTANIGENLFYTKIISENDDRSNDTFTVKTIVERAPIFNLKSDNKLTIEMDIDQIASEVGFAFRKGIPVGTPEQVFDKASSSNSIAYVGMGSLYDNQDKTFFSRSYTVDEAGCYHFVVVDGFGDGIVFRNPDGEARLISQSTIHIPGDWGKGTIKILELVNNTATVSANSYPDMEIYPNPVVDEFYIKGNFSGDKNVSVEIIDKTGRILYRQKANIGSRRIKINTSDISSGIYFVKVKGNTHLVTKKIMINKS